MRRFAIAGLVALLAASAAAATATVAAVPASSARLQAFVCQTALDPAARGMSITAVMRPVPDTKRLAMRFELLKRTKRYGRSVSLTGTDLKTWITPKDPTLGSRPGDRWLVKHPVVSLAAPAWYRFKVTFRWTGADRHVLAKTVRESRLCYQPELRADLEVVTPIAVSALAAHPGFDAFVAQIRNAGRTASGPFQVEFTDGSAAPKFKPVTQLLPHHSVYLRFTGPACSAAAPATVVADPSHQVDDANPANNALESTCA
jgi:CARDB